MVKLKEIPRTSTFAWSPSANPLLVTGTVARAIDEDFSSTTQLELWDLSLLDHSPESFQLKPKVSIDTEARFYDIAWGGASSSNPNGFIAGALEGSSQDSGSLQIWNPDDIFKGKYAPVEKSDKHSAAIKAIDFNPNQSHLLASGGLKGEVFVWDINKFSAPYAPGTQSSRHDEIESVAWNNNVAHILATGGNTGFTSVWDLKNKREVLHLYYNPGGAGHRSAVSSIVWHPNNSTKLITASVDDLNPVILLWDLRNANAPERVLSGHEKGVLSLDWCKQDSGLLLSGGKDNRTLLWNPETGEKLGEYPIAVNWSFKTKFNKRIPDIFASASFDGKITIQTLQDVVADDKVEKRRKEEGATPDDFWNPSSYVDTLHPTFVLKQAPKWLKRPVSVSFGFGGKIVSIKTANDTSKIVISKFVEDESVSEETGKFASALQRNDLAKVVNERVESVETDSDKFDWKVLSTFLNDRNADKRVKFAAIIGEEQHEEGEEGEEKKEEVDDDFLSSLSISDSKYIPNGSFSLFSGKASESDKLISKAILKKNYSGAVDIALKQGDISDAFMLALYADDKAKDKVKNFYINKNAESKPFIRLLSAVAENNLDDLVENSDIKEWKQIINALLIHTTSENEFKSLVTRLGDRLSASRNEVSDKSSKQAEELRNYSLFCYIAGSSLEKTASIWLNEIPIIETQELKSKRAASSYSAHVKALHLFIEKITIFVESAKINPSTAATTTGLDQLYEAYRDYASIVASQGLLDLAKRYLDLLPLHYPGVSLEKERIAKAGKKGVTASGATRTTTTTNRYGSTAAASSLYSNIPKAPIPNAAPQPVQNVQTYQHQQPPPPQQHQHHQPPPPQQQHQQQQFTSQYAPAGAPQPPQPPQPTINAPNPYQPQGYQNIGTVPITAPQIPGPPPIAKINSPTNAPPPPSKKKAGGWNDLPVSAIGAPRRPPSTAQTIASPFPNQPLNSSPPINPSPNTIDSFSNTLPPPPTSGGINRQGSLSPRVPSSNPYAPPPGSGSINKPPSPYNSFHNDPSSIPPPGPRSVISPPPPNPYAPSPNSQHQQQQQLQQQGGPVPTNNPYAPPPGQQQHFQQPPPGINNYSANIPGYGVPPPPSPGRNLVPNIASVVNKEQPPPPVEEPVAPPPPKYPPGDRSHIAPNAQPIFEILTNELARVKPVIPINFQRQVSDAEKRLNILFDHLNNDDLLSEETVADLVVLSQSLVNKDYNTATQLHIDILTTRSEQCGQWMTGVKRLIEMSKAVP